MKKKIENLSVHVTYRVGLEDVEVEENILRGLEAIVEDVGGSISSDEAQLSKNKDVHAAYEWLNSNINEDDAFSWEHEIEEINSEDD